MSKTEKHIKYYTNGNKKEEGTFKDGKQVGKWTWHNEDGSVKEVKEF